MFLGKTPHELQSLSSKPQQLGLGRGPGTTAPIPPSQRLVGEMGGHGVWG